MIESVHEIEFLSYLLVDNWCSWMHSTSLLSVLSFLHGAITILTLYLVGNSCWFFLGLLGLLVYLGYFEGLYLVCVLQ